MNQLCHTLLMDHLIFSFTMALFLITLQLLLVVLPFFDPNGVVTMATPFTEEPKNKTATLGSTVSFTCKRNPSEDAPVLWYRVNSQTYLSRNKAFFEPANTGHYSFSGTDKNDFTLTIHNVTSADAGHYQCLCFANADYLSPSALLTVYIPPPSNFPSCRISAREESLYIGQRLSFHCTSAGGKPAADLKWIRGMNEVLETTNIKTHNSISIYRTYLRPQDFGKVYTCIASSPALDMPRTCAIGPLYPTSAVQIDVIPEIDTSDEGLQPVSFGCSANFSEFEKYPSNFPPVLNYSWYINDYQVEFGDGVVLDSDRQFMFLNQTTHLPRNTQISCQAFGPYGSLGNASVIINDKLYDEEEIYQEITEPMVYSIGRKPKSKKFDIRPIVFINAGGLMLLVTMILIVVCVPKQCRCLKKQRSALRRRDSRYADMQFTQTNGCPSPLLMTPETNMNTYESTDSDTESSKGMSGNGSIPTVTSMSQNQQQQVQATLHVVVHSANNQAQTTTLKACSTDDFDDQHSLYHELPPMPSTPPPPPPPPNDQPGSPTKKKADSYSTPVKIPTKMSPTKTWGSGTKLGPGLLSYDHTPAQQNQYAPTTCATTATAAGCYVRTLPLPTGHGKIITTSCLRCNGNKTNNNHFATYRRAGDSVGVVYENIPLPPHTCDCPPPAPL